MSLYQNEQGAEIDVPVRNFIVLNTSVMIFNIRFVIFDTESIVFNAKCMIFNSKFILFDTKSIIFVGARSRRATGNPIEN